MSPDEIFWTSYAPWIPRPTPERCLRYWLRTNAYVGEVRYLLEALDAVLDESTARWILYVRRPNWLPAQFRVLPVYTLTGRGLMDARHAIQHAWTHLSNLGVPRRARILTAYTCMPAAECEAEYAAHPPLARRCADSEPACDRRWHSTARVF